MSADDEAFLEQLRKQTDRLATLIDGQPKFALRYRAEICDELSGWVSHAEAVLKESDRRALLGDFAP